MSSTKTLAKSDPFLAPEGTACWPYLFEKDERGKHRVTVIVPKGSDISALQKAITDTARNAWGDRAFVNQGGKVRLSPKITIPLKNGDEKFDPEGQLYNGFENSWYFDTSTTQPMDGHVLDMDKSLLNPFDKAKIYSGCKLLVQINAFAWEYSENGAVLKRGVSFGLCNVMKTGDGERLGGDGGGVSAADAFANVEAKPTAANDATNYGDDPFGAEDMGPAFPSEAGGMDDVPF